MKYGKALISRGAVPRPYTSDPSRNLCQSARHSEDQIGLSDDIDRRQADLEGIDGLREISAFLHVRQEPERGLLGGVPNVRAGGS
jgi:hypothetical protein